MTEIFLIILCSFLGAYGGSSNTSLAWRRYGVPSLLSFYTCFTLWSFYPILVMALAGVFSIGYGIPDNHSDDGSTLGAFWYHKTKSHLLADIFMRGTVGLLACIALIVLPIISGAWLKYAGACLLMVGAYVLFGALIPGEPVIRWTLKGKHYEILTEDLMIYASIAFGVVLII